MIKSNIYKFDSKYYKTNIYRFVPIFGDVGLWNMKVKKDVWITNVYDLKNNINLFKEYINKYSFYSFSNLLYEFKQFLPISIFNNTIAYEIFNNTQLKNVVSINKFYIENVILEDSFDLKNILSFYVKKYSIKNIDKLTNYIVLE
jgi:hypothetical protein